jgi:hypothetical protein
MMPRTRLSFMLALVLLATTVHAQDVQFAGSSPQMARDTEGTIRVVFGRRDSIFVATSQNAGSSFSSETLVGVIPDMHVGNTRGPTIGSSRRYSVIMAIDHSGTVHRFSLDHASGTWRKLRQPLNTAAGSAPEGLASIAADGADNFHAVWLDLRTNRQNQIYYSSFAGSQDVVTTNRIIYASPDGHVCECCRPTVAVKDGRVAVMFRNWLAGARDMYALSSSDKGRTFSVAQKLGRQTWVLNACPMDGGDVSFDDTGRITTVWRREHSIYLAYPGQPEQLVAEGRSPALSQYNRVTWLVWQDGSSIRARKLSKQTSTVVGEGRLPQVLTLPGGDAVVAWEKSGQVYLRRIR